MTNSVITLTGLLSLSLLFVIFPWLHGLDLVWEQLLFSACVFLLLSLTCISKPLFFSPGLRWVSALFAVWLGWCALYLIPVSPDVLTMLSPKTRYWYELGQAEEFYFSVYRQASLIECFKFLTLPVLVWLVWLLARSHKRLKLLANLIVLGCTITALYSLLNFFTSGAYELVESIQPWDLAWEHGIRGTFSYKNQYGMYLSLSLALACGLLIQNLRFNGSWRYTGLLTLQLLILAATLINTSSRGAIVSLVAGATLTCLLFIIRNRAAVKRFITVKMLGIAAVLFVVVGIGFTHSSVYDRFANQQLEDNGRAYLRQTAIGVINDHPLMGSGPGTYPYIQHVYKPMELGISKMSKRAHNDYLETIATTGVVGFVLLALPIGLLLFNVFRNAGAEANGVLIGVRTALLAFLIQSAFDTNTGIFFLPVLFITLLSIGFVLNTLERKV